MQNAPWMMAEPRDTGSQLTHGSQPEVLWFCPLKSAHTSVPRALEMVFWFCPSSWESLFLYWVPTSKPTTRKRRGMSGLWELPRVPPCQVCPPVHLSLAHVSSLQRVTPLGFNRQKQEDCHVFLGDSKPTDRWCFVLFFNLFYWRIVDLQCSVSFCCLAKWFSYTYTYILFHILFHDGLSQDIEYSSLCYKVGPCCLSILYVIVCIC